MDHNQSPAEWLTKYLRVANYLGAAQLYLKENFLLEEELKPEHIKRRILGHWGTVPGLNFIYGALDYAISKYEQEMLLVVGPGHGYPAVQANLFLEGSLGEFFPKYNPHDSDSTERKNSYGRLIKNFSWPHKFPSHSNPTTPGCILEGGELGYSLATSFGAAFDNPNLIVACIVGDGEAETGPTATAWHSNKFLNPITSGAVLPIVHVNGYKISNPTIYGTMSNEELTNLFMGYGYHPIIVDGDMLFEPLIAAVEASIEKIKFIQNEARNTGIAGQPKWPVIILRSPKGWFGPGPIKEGFPIVGSFRSHGIPLEDPIKDEHQFQLLKTWLESYKVRELIDADYNLHTDVLEYVPKGDLRMGMNKNSRAAGSKDLILPKLEDYAVKFDHRGTVEEGCMPKLAEYFRDVFKLNENNKNFRFFCPDELVSNKLGDIFEATKRAYLWPVKSHDEDLSPDGRVMEMLSEHTLNGWMEGYTLTGRHGVFATYEAFAEVISSMVDQYSKFLRHAREIKWRNPVPSLNFILTSVSWRQDHNGFSHQNPGFISSVLNDYADYVSVYFPADANSALVVMEEVLRSRNKINVIVAGKRPLPQLLTLDDARLQIKNDIRIWDFASDENPDIVFATCGDYLTREIIAARIILKRLVPDIRLRVVGITELSNFGIGDNHCKCRIDDAEFRRVFTEDKPIIFNYHGYSEDIKALIFNHHAASRFVIHGYHEKGTTTTPFDMLVWNRVDRYNLALEALNLAVAKRSELMPKAEEAKKTIVDLLKKHAEYILENGVDIPEIEGFKFEF
ncbi:phosphoketolase family protein [Candidatus Dojkabacteria bacterium]|nr:phosphoketolase family protein [Candidatus Dojkabacteria bacterium]